MTARPKKEAEPVNESAAAADDSGIYLDPDLAKLRDAEAKVLADLPDAAPRGLVEDPAIDPELVKLRDAEIKAGDREVS
jgi:hypothetical protein